MKELDIEKLLLQMTEDDFDNIKKIRKVFGSLSYQDENSISILHILVKQKYNEQKCLLAIRSLLKFGINPNLEDNNSKCNFIQIAIYNGYSKEFILKVIKEALKYNLNVGKIYKASIRLYIKYIGTNYIITNNACYMDIS